MGHRLTTSEKTLRMSGVALTATRITDLDPRVRIAVAMLFAIVVVGLSDVMVLLCALMMAALLLPVSGLPLGRTLKRMAGMDGFILFMLVMLPFTVPGTSMFTLWGITASWEGLWQAVEIALTANAVVLALMCLVGSMEPVTLGHALLSLKVPERLVQLLMFTIRYIETLREEYTRLRAAMKIRGFRPGTNWHTYQSFGYLVGMMLVRALERSERVLGAMKCRGFSGTFILLQDFRITTRDWFLVAATLIGTCLLIALEVRDVLA